METNSRFDQFQGTECLLKADAQSFARCRGSGANSCSPVLQGGVRIPPLFPPGHRRHHTVSHPPSALGCIVIIEPGSGLVAPLPWRTEWGFGDEFPALKDEATLLGGCRPLRTKSPIVAFEYRTCCRAEPDTCHRIDPIPGIPVPF